MADYTITITIDGNGNFTHSPSLLRVTKNDRVFWQCQYAFAIMFDEGTPLDNMMMQAQTGLSTGSNSYPFSTPLINVNNDAVGNFHYAVALWDGSHVWVDAGCPVIVAN